MVLSIEEYVFLVVYVFWEGSRYTNLVPEQFDEKFPEHLHLIAVHFRNLLGNLVQKVQC
jgi:hypothetical protein